MLLLGTKTLGPAVAPHLPKKNMIACGVVAGEGLAGNDQQRARESEKVPVAVVFKIEGERLNQMYIRSLLPSLRGQACSSSSSSSRFVPCDATTAVAAGCIC